MTKKKKFIFLLLGTLLHSQLSFGQQLWTSGVIPYSFEDNLQKDESFRKIFNRAIEHYQQSLAGVVTFVECQDKKDLLCQSKKTKKGESHLLVGKRKKCYSETVGRKEKGPQVLGLNNSCLFEGVMLHLLGHVIGLNHSAAELSIMNPGGKPWAPGGGIPLDFSSIWELYSTLEGWEPFVSKKNKVRLSGTPFVLSLGKGNWEYWGRGRDNFLYYRTYASKDAAWIKAGQEILFSDPTVIMTDSEKGKREIFFADKASQLVQLSLQLQKGKLMTLKRTILEGPTTLFRPWVIPREDGGWHLFLRGADAQVYHMRYSSLGRTTWENLGGNVTSSPAALLTRMENGEEQIDVMSTDTEGKVWRKSWKEGRWWPSLGGWSRDGMGELKVESQLSASSCVPGSFVLLAKGPKGILYSKFWRGGNWEDWSPVGGIMKTAPFSSCDEEGNLHVWTLGENWNLWHKRFVHSGSLSTSARTTFRHLCLTASQFVTFHFKARRIHRQGR